MFNSYEEAYFVCLFFVRNKVPSWVLTASMAYPVLKFAIRKINNLDSKPNNEFIEKYNHLL
jgi:hypothetical protein